MIRSLTTSATNAGSTVEKKDVAGLELNVIVPKESTDDPTLYYGMKDNWLVVVGDTTKDLAFAESSWRNAWAAACPAAWRRSPGSSPPPRPWAIRSSSSS